jgi:ribosomal protein S18 acetylase RimI-like enzyme
VSESCDTPAENDPRITSVENALFDFTPLFATSEITFEREDDVQYWTSAINFPMCNGVVNARFAPTATTRRANEVLDRMIANGRSFMWWLTPSTSSPELQALLVERGMVSDEPTIGMHRELSATPPRGPLPEGVTIEVTTADTLDDTILTICDGFGMPRDLLPTFREVLDEGSEALTLTHVLARDTGTPAGSGTLAVANGVAALFNIAVRPEARGKGVGRALTLELMQRGAEQGCAETVLHATPMGLPVYVKLGYEPVCEMPLYVWTPPLA